MDDTVYSFTLKYADQNTSVIFANAEKTNDEPTGEITIEKTDKDTGNQNRADNKSHHGDATLNGTVHTLYAAEDIYNVAHTIKYFSKDEQIATFTFNEHGVASVKITNTSTPAKLNVRGNTLCGIPLGRFYSRETTVPVGYNQDSKTYEYVLKYANSTTPVIKVSGTVENTVMKAPFEIIKVSTNTNATAEVVPNAEFTMILLKYVDFYGSFEEALKHLDEFAEDEYDIVTTDNRGHAISKKLAYGVYMGRETYTPSAEINTVEDFYVTIDGESNTPIKEMAENDSLFEAYLKLQKKDKESGKFVTFSNATFKLEKLNEDNGQWEKVQCKVGDQYFETWTTDENGIAKTETKVEAGTFKLSEIKIPTGFIQLDEEIIFKVDNRNSTLNYDKDWDAWITVTAENSQPKGKLELTKKVKLRDNVDKTLIKDIDYTQISFALTSEENIIDYADGSIIYKAGETVGKYNLNSDGTLTINNIWMGKYTLQELSTISGCVLDDTKYEITFEQTDTTTKEYTVKLDITNNTTLVEFSKTDITGDSELVGAKLTVKDENDEVIDSWKSTENTHKIEGLVPGKEYTLTEEIAPDGFVKATSIKFTVKDTGEVQKVQMVDKIVEMSKVDIAGNEVVGAKIYVLDEEKNIVDEWISEKEPHKIKNLVEGKCYTLHEEVSVGNYVKATDQEFTVSYDKETQHLEMIDKLVAVKKTDFVTGKEVVGAELEITDENDNIIDSWTSTAEEHYVAGLEEGKTYKLTEKTCPYGYEIAESIEFTVSTDKETQLVEMKDMPILKNVRLIKKDSDTDEVIKADFTFGLYEDPECTKLIQEVKSNKDTGIVTFENLRYGEAFVKEISAPKNYQLSDKVVKITINENGVFADDELLEETDATCEFVFYNTPMPKVQTGNETNYILLISIAIISLLAIIVGIVVLKRNI